MSAFLSVRYIFCPHNNALSGFCGLSEAQAWRGFCHYFRPFSCKGFYLCPSCSQKRTLLLSEHFTEEVFLELPHRQFVFTVPKVLRLIFRRNRTLFAKVSRLINQLISDFYSYATGRTIRFGMIAAHQTFGDMLRWNPHFHCVIRHPN
jgi:hypothetical protein